jgi:hypothetical protein
MSDLPPGGAPDPGAQAPEPDRPSSGPPDLAGDPDASVGPAPGAAALAGSAPAAETPAGAGYADPAAPAFFVHAPVAAPPRGPAGPSPFAMFVRPKFVHTYLVAVVIAIVVLGGLGLDAAIAAPSAGTVAIGGTATLTAAPGWVFVQHVNGDQGVELQKGNAFLDAIVDTSVSGDSGAVLDSEEKGLNGGSAQVTFGATQKGNIGQYDTAIASFEAVITSSSGTGTGGSGVVDGELVCMVVDGQSVVIEAYAPQGLLNPVSDDIVAMIKSVGVKR